jgi:TPR repeat protein
LATESQIASKYKGTSLADLTAAAGKGEAPAQFELGRRYLRGEGVETNLMAAAQWIRKSAEAGLAVAQNRMGVMTEEGTGVPQDTADAVRWYRLGADGGAPGAWYNLAQLAQEGKLPGAEPKDALRFFELAAEQGYTDAAVELGWLYRNPPTGAFMKLEESAYWFKFAASKGNPRAYSGLGWFYAESLSFDIHDPDYAEARRWFKLGTDQKRPDSAYGLAMLELNQHKENPDIDFVRTWLLKATEGPYPGAFYQLGKLSERPPNPNYAEAAEWYQRGADAKDQRSSERLTELTMSGKAKASGNLIEQLRKASDLGDLKARTELAVRYLKGEAKPRNEADEPAALLHSADRVGNGRAMLELSDLYRLGNHVKQDLIRAVDFLFAAARNRSEEAFDRIVKLRTETEGQAPQPGEPRKWEQAFSDYVRALQTSKPEPAIVLAKRYEDGTYEVDKFQALMWYSVAIARQGEPATAEAERLTSELGKNAAEDAKNYAKMLVFRSNNPLPGF